MNVFSFFKPAAWAMGLVLSLGISARGAISLGIDELEKTNFAILQGKRVGLITNPSGADSKGRSAIDVLYGGSGFHLVKLFGPEHGIDGKTGAGLKVSNSRDPKTHLPIYSLFITPEGNFRHPTPQMFSGLDVIVYDVQDLGNRSYTFISTLGYAMDEAAKDGIEFIVLDRPNPLGGVRIEGPRLDSSFKPSFVGLYDIPYVFGLTPGELAQWINAKYLPKPCKLTVLTMKGWLRSMVWEDTGLKWVPTSPNIPTIGAARGYTATGILGEIGIETGIGSPYPFQIVSGTGWDVGDVAKRFSALHIPGVKASAYHYRTSSGAWAGAEYSGVFLQIDPRNAGNLTAINFQAIDILEREVSHFSAFGRTKFDQRDMFDKVCCNTSIRRQIGAGRPAADIIRSWDSGVARWAEERAPYLLYGNTPTHREIIANGAGGMPVAPMTQPSVKP
jgi:uncharacterized protein YbbC (DUF1343 family)